MWWWWLILDVPEIYYMFAAILVLLVVQLCRGGSESPYPPIEILRVAQKKEEPPKLFADKPSESKIHLSEEIRDTIRQHEEEKTKNKLVAETTTGGDAEESKFLKERVATLEKLLASIDSRMNTLEDWVQVETQLLEQDILLRAKAHKLKSK
jgi:hypothetical protein